MVLVVDDDPQMRRTVRRIFERAGHHVIEADSETTAKEALAMVQVDFVLTDLELGAGGSGAQVIGHARAAGVQVALHSGSLGGDSIEDGVPYFSKPVEPRKLLALLDRPEGQSGGLGQ